MRLQLNNFTQKLNFHVLWFRRRRAYKILEEKKEKKRKKVTKKEKNLIAAKSGLVGMKGYLRTYNLMKYFFPYLLEPFLTETAFYAKLSGRFSGPKTKVT